MEFIHVDPTQNPSKRRQLKGNTFTVRTTGLSQLAHLKSSSTNHSAVSPTVSTFAQGLTDEEKTRTLRFMLHKYDNEPSTLSAKSLRAIASEHHIPYQKKDLLIQALQAHTCIWSCLVHLADASEAIQLHLGGNTSLDPIDRSQKPSEARPRKKRRLDALQLESQAVNTDKEIWAENWPQIEPEDSLKEVDYNYV